jgi:hypothetical protein
MATKLTISEPCLARSSNLETLDAMVGIRVYLAGDCGGRQQEGIAAFEIHKKIKEFIKLLICIPGGPR